MDNVEYTWLGSVWPQEGEEFKEVLPSWVYNYGSEPGYGPRWDRCITPSVAAIWRLVAGDTTVQDNPKGDE